MDGWFAAMVQDAEDFSISIAIALVQIDRHLFPIGYGMSIICNNHLFIKVVLP